MIWKVYSKCEIHLEGIYLNSQVSLPLATAELQNWQLRSINFLNSCSTSTTWRGIAEIRHAALWHTTTSRGLVDLHHDRVHDAFQFFLLSLEFIFLSKLVLVKPIEGFLHCRLDLLLIATLKLILQLFFL